MTTPKSNTPRPLIAIYGPTGSGKSALAIELAQRFDGFIISADSRHIYKGMDILTGKITPAEQQTVPHELIDIKNPDEDYSAQQFQTDTYDILQHKYKSKLAFITGGTGLYIDAVTEGFNFSEAKPNPALRAKLSTQTNAELFTTLQAINPELATTLDPNNTHRLIRAIERELSATATTATSTPPTWLRTLKLAIDIPRDELYNRINTRVESWFQEDAAIHEAEQLFTTYDPNLPAFTGIGYSHIKSHLDGSITRTQCISLIARDNRRYAKRQLTWLRRTPSITWINNTNQAIDLITEFLKD